MQEKTWCQLRHQNIPEIYFYSDTYRLVEPFLPCYELLKENHVFIGFQFGGISVKLIQVKREQIRGRILIYKHF